MEANDGKTWREWEIHGDGIWERAYGETSHESMQDLWLQALESYESAYNILMDELSELLDQSGGELDQARLCRKRARCYRKLDDGTGRAATELEEANKLLDQLPADDAEIRIQKAHVHLEQAFLGLMGERSAQPQDCAEKTISLCIEPPVRGKKESWRILGDAYNVLGIALDQRKDLKSVHCAGPDECWKLAYTKYSVAGGDVGKRGKRDVMIQRAVRLQRRGNYDEAERIFEKVKHDLTPERALVVENDLIDMDLERGEPDKAYYRAEALLMKTRDAGDVEGQILARQLLLKALRDRMPSWSESAIAEHLKKAYTYYHEGLDFLGRLSSRETAPDRLELHRVMIEVYLQAGDLRSAERVLSDACAVPGFPLPDVAPVAREEAKDKLLKGERLADWEVTMARIQFLRGEIEPALERARRARDFFRKEQHRRAIKAGLLELEILWQEDDLMAASDVLYEIEPLATGKGRTADIKRIEEWTERIGSLFSYERGLDALGAQVGQTNRYREFARLNAKLHEFLRGEGPRDEPETTRRARARVIRIIDELAQVVLGLSLDELARGRVPATGQVSARDSSLVTELGVTPSHAGIKPPVQSRLQDLPFNELSWDQFEALCAALIEFQPSRITCSLYGLQGDFQKGIDIVAKQHGDKGDETWAYQCKKYEKYTPGLLTQALDKMTYDADYYVLMLSIPAKVALRKIADARTNVFLWDAKDIARKLKDYPAIVEDFFGEEWRRAFCG